jgi:hypothetical protein
MIDSDSSYEWISVIVFKSLPLLVILFFRENCNPGALCLPPILEVLEYRSP